MTRSSFASHKACVRRFAFAALAFASLQNSHGAKVVAIGDSLTAEYDTIPAIAGFPTEATAYAEITVPGWVSRSWVEVLGKLRGSDFDFGSWRNLSDPWPVPRLSGYERNWAVPGITAAQGEDFLTASIVSNPLYYTLRQPLEDQLSSHTNRVVVWLGGNEFRANYGALYDGGSSTSLINGLIGDLDRILDFVESQNPDLQVVICNVPDLGATPSKQEAHPDPEKRALVTAATNEANARIAELAAAHGAGLADIAEETRKIIDGEPVYFGGVEILPGKDEDNNPHYAFTRDGLHPNTPFQIRIAKTIVKAFNQKFGAGLRQIDSGEALRLLKIDPNEPYHNWILSYNVPKPGYKKDTDGDGLNHLVEYAFGLSPVVADADSLPVSVGGPIEGINGNVSITYTPDPAHAHHVQIIPQYSVKPGKWIIVPATNIVENEGTFTAVIPPTVTPAKIRLKITTITLPGWPVTLATPLPLALPGEP